MFRLSKSCNCYDTRQSHSGNMSFNTARYQFLNCNYILKSHTDFFFFFTYIIVNLYNGQKSKFCGTCISMFAFQSGTSDVLTSRYKSGKKYASKEKPFHSSSHALSIIEEIKLINKLINGVTPFRDGPKVGHEINIITLIVIFCFECIRR